MKPMRNAPCPCGSGKKYKKCCIAQDQEVAEKQRRLNQEAQQMRIAAWREEVDALDKYIDGLDEQSNLTNDLIREERWEEAREACEELMERYPKETDGDERCSEYYKQRGDFIKAKAHAEAALEKARGNPDKFAPELVECLTEEVAYLEECHRAGKLV